MELKLAEEQKIFRETAADFLTTNFRKDLIRKMETEKTSISPELWHKIAELGWLGLIFPGTYGGQGKGFIDLVLLLEQMGRVLMPSVFLSTIIGGLAIFEGGSEKQKQELLPNIVKGGLYLTGSLEGKVELEANANQVKASSDKNGNYTLTGSKLFVPDVDMADYMICVAEAGKEVALFLVDTKSPGITSVPMLTELGDRPFEVVFNDVSVTKDNVLGGLGQGVAIMRKVLDKAAVAKCAEMCGMSEEVLEMAVLHAKQREQFGRPIGSFQVIRAYCADMSVDADASRYLTYQAAWLIDQGLPCSKEISIAKARVNQACRRAVVFAQEIHGGMGTLTDHPMQRYYRREKVAEIAFGSTDMHLKTVADQILA